MAKSPIPHMVSPLGQPDEPLDLLPPCFDRTPWDRSEWWLSHRRSFLLAGFLGLGGCKSWNLGGGRSKTPETVDGDKTIYVSTMARIWGAAPVRIDGVGMVSELAGTGSAPAPTRFRDELTEDLRIRNVPEPNKLLGEDWTSLVLLQGILPAGCRKGYEFDVFVGLDPGSQTSSLEGGFLMPARMSPQMSVAGGRTRQGRLAGQATGPVVVHSVFDGDGRNAKVTGVVPGGGRSTIDRPVGFQTKEDYRSIRDTMAVSASINARFNYIVNSQRQPVANAKNDSTIDLEVPQIYHSNINRYLHVVRNIAVGESAAAQVSRLEVLEQQLQNPKTAEVASLRLEALGEVGLAILERALRHSDPKVRFMAAMSLVYQQKPQACDELGRLAEQEWAFRWHALTALNALNDNAAKQTLRRLLHSPSVETRYGAVRCLVTKTTDDPEVSVESFGPGGEEKENFQLKTVYSTADPVIHVARYKAPEVIVFNPDQALKPGFLFVVAGWTVESRSNGMVSIQNFQQDGRDRSVQCNAQITDVLRQMGRMGATYTMVIRFLKQAAEEQSLDGRLVINALPKAERAYDPSGGTMAMPEMFQGELDTPQGQSFEPDPGDETLVSTPLSDEPSDSLDLGQNTPPSSASRFKWPWQS